MGFWKRRSGKDSSAQSKSRAELLKETQRGMLAHGTKASMSGVKGDGYFRAVTEGVERDLAKKHGLSKSEVVSLVNEVAQKKGVLTQKEQFDAMLKSAASELGREGLHRKGD